MKSVMSFKNDLLSLTEQDISGYDLKIFTKKPEEKYLCPICLMVLKVPTQTTCGHLFCKVCIKKWIQYVIIYQIFSMFTSFYSRINEKLIYLFIYFLINFFKF